MKQSEMLFTDTPDKLDSVLANMDELPKAKGNRRPSVILFCSIENSSGHQGLQRELLLLEGAIAVSQKRCC